MRGGRSLSKKWWLIPPPNPSVKAKNREEPFPGDNKCSQIMPSIELDEGKNEEAFSSVLAD
jgi:hypothetical protein